MKELFPILSIETTDSLCSTAILLNEEDYFELNIQGKHIHSQKLVLMVQELLESSGLRLSEIKSLSISEGPGSFTGLRIGMSAAKGIAVGGNIPLILVPTFSALALKISAYLKPGTKFSIIKTASKDDNYFAMFQAQMNGTTELTNVQLVKNDEISSYLDDNVIIYSNNNSFSQNSHLTIPSAIDIGKWAYKFGEDLLTFNLDLIEPKYLKKFLMRT